jgi:hypothetical protein
MNWLHTFVEKINEYPCISGTAIFLGAFLLRHIIKRRMFYRRNAQGLQRFRSYSRSVIIPFFERIIILTSLLLMFIGVVLFMMGLSK